MFTFQIGLIGCNQNLFIFIHTYYWPYSSTCVYSFVQLLHSYLATVIGRRIKMANGMEQMKTGENFNRLTLLSRNCNYYFIVLNWDFSPHIVVTVWSHHHSQINHQSVPRSIFFFIFNNILQLFSPHPCPAKGDYKSL